jgi:hypothetical protein
MDQEKTQKSFALLVHACDRYEFLYQGFEYFFNQFWNSDIKCKYYFATEVIDVNIPGFENIKSGKGEWSDRLAYLLREKITEDYVIYMQEDVWLSKPVSKAFFDDLFDFVQEKSHKQIKLHSSDIYQTLPTEKFVRGLNFSKVDNTKSRYLMSHQLTLWDRAFFVAQLPPKENPWRNERRGTKRLKSIDPEIWHIDYFSQDYSEPINENQDITERSNFNTVSQNGKLNDEVCHFIELLRKGDEKAVAYAKELENHYDNSLTHDGKEQPRKIDFVKRLKNWVLNK